MKKLLYMLVASLTIIIVGSFNNSVKAEDYYLTVDNNGNSTYLVTETIQFSPCEYREDGVGSYFCNVKVVPPNADSFSVDKYQINFTQSLNFIKNGEMYGLGKSGRVASNKNSVEMKIVAYLKKYHRDHGRGDLEGY